MNNSGINSKPVTYSDLLAIIKEVVQLRTRLTTRPSEQDIKDYKLLIKVFEAYARIREHQDILVDTISGVIIPETETQISTTQITSSDTTSIVLEKKNLSKKSLVDQKPNQSENNIIYLFGNNQPSSEPVTEVSDCDSDMDPNELFEDYKIIPNDKDDKDKDNKTDTVDKDDKDVELMLKKSAFQLSRAISNKNYIVTEEEVTDEVIVDEVIDTNKTTNTDTVVTSSDTNVITDIVTSDNFSENSVEDQQQYGFKKPDVYYDSVCQKYNGGVDKYHDVFY